MIPLENIKNGSQFVVTAAGAKDGIHQMLNFTPVVQGNATYPNDDPDHTFCPNGTLPDGANRPDPVAEGLPLKAGMVITVDQLVYHCAKTAGDQKAYQCVHGTVIDPGNSAFKAITGYFYLTYADVTRFEPYTAPAEPPGPVTPVDTKLTIVSGGTTIVSAVVKDGAFTKFEKQIRIGTPGGADDGGVGPGGGVVIPGGGVVIPGGSGRGGSGDTVAEILTDTVEPVPATEEWLPDTVIDYHMGQWTAVKSNNDPRFLIASSTGNCWSLGVGGWILLGFTKGFPASPAFEVEYKEAPSKVPQSIDVWIAKIGVKPEAPVKYLTSNPASTKTESTNVYNPLSVYIPAPLTFQPKNPPAGHEWAGPAWSFVGKTGKARQLGEVAADGDAKSLPSKDGEEGSLSRIPLIGNASPGIYHYMLIVDSRAPNESAREEKEMFGGPDVGRIRVVKNDKGIHFLLLVDGSKSTFGDDKKYGDAIRKCVYRALSLSYVGDKRLTVFFIREDFEETKFPYSEADLKGALVEDIVVRIMAELNSGWTKERNLGQRTPLAATINNAAEKAKAILQQSKEKPSEKAWIPAVIIVSDGIHDPQGAYNGKKSVLLKENKATILNSIKSSSGEVNQELVSLGKLGVGYLTKLVGPWLTSDKDGDENQKFGNEIRQAYAEIQTEAGKPLLETIYGLEPDMTDSINHGTVFHTDCLASDGDLHRIGNLAAKRLIRKYDTGGANLGFQKCRSGKSESLEGYSSLLDRDVHHPGAGTVGKGRANYAAVFTSTDKKTAKGEMIWEMTKQTTASGEWQSVDPPMQYILDDDKFTSTQGLTVVVPDVWRPYSEANKR